MLILCLQMPARPLNCHPEICQRSICRGDSHGGLWRILVGARILSHFIVDFPNCVGKWDLSASSWAIVCSIEESI